jgi:7-carboxy-7-deazaguanine synthase
VKEIYYTLQGEGARSGRAACSCASPAAICGAGWSATGRTPCANSATRISWERTGRAAENSRTPKLWRGRSAKYWPKDAVAQPYVVCTGGEPLLQLDEALIAALHAQGFEIGIETNGTLPAPHGIEWICVSPKANAELVLTSGQELKLVYPQEGAPPERYAGLMFDHFFLQPMDGPEREPTRAPRRTIVSPIRNGASACKRTS